MVEDFLDECFVSTLLVHGQSRLTRRAESLRWLSPIRTDAQCGPCSMHLLLPHHQSPNSSAAPPANPQPLCLCFFCSASLLTSYTHSDALFLTVLFSMVCDASPTSPLYLTNNPPAFPTIDDRCAQCRKLLSTIQCSVPSTAGILERHQITCRS